MSNEKKIDKGLIKRRFEANFSEYDSSATVQREICERLARMVERHVARPPETILEIGAGTGNLTRDLKSLFPESQWVINDISPESEPFFEPIFDGTEPEYRWGDAEQIDFPHAVELIASASTVQWFENLPRFIEKCAAATQKNGYLAVTTFGEENFREVKVAVSKGLKYYSKDELVQLLESNGYRVMEVEEYSKRLKFGSPIEVLRHMKSTGVNGLASEKWTKGRLEQFSTRYREACGGEITLTYHPILILALKM